MRHLRDFWREQDNNPVPFDLAVQRAQNTLHEEGWKCLIAALESLLLHRTMQYMTKGVVAPLDLDECQHAFRTASINHLQPTAPAGRPRRRRSPVSEAAPANVWGPSELAAIMALSVTGVTPENIAPGSAPALRVLRLLMAGLTAARARQRKTKATAPARSAGKREENASGRK